MTELNVLTAPKDVTFRMNINPEIKAEAERIYAQYGLTMEKVFNIVLQRTLVEGTIPVGFKTAHERCGVSRLY